MARIAIDEMYRAFNMGIGLVLACAASDQARVLALLNQQQAVVVGRVNAGERDSELRRRLNGVSSLSFLIVFRPAISAILQSCSFRHP